MSEIQHEPEQQEQVSALRSDFLSVSQFRFKLSDLFVLTLLAVLSLYPPSWLKAIIPQADHANWDRAQLISFLSAIYGVLFSICCLFGLMLERASSNRIRHSTRLLVWAFALGISILCLRHSILAVIVWQISSSPDVLRHQVMYALQFVPTICTASGITCFAISRFRKDGEELEIQLSLLDLLTFSTLWLWVLIWCLTPFLSYIPIPGIRVSGFPW